MKSIEAVGFNILLKKIMVAVFITLWVPVSNLIYALTALLESALTDLINDN